MPALLLARVYGLYLLLLDRTGAAARISRFEIAVLPEHRAAWLVVLAGSAVLLLYAALASGPDTRVRSFRAAGLVLGATLPLAGLRLVPGLWRAPFAGGVIVLVLAAALLHRALAARRREGTAARAIERVRWLVEAVGLALFGAAAWREIAGEDVDVRLAFWALFLLRISIADLLRTSRLAARAGLPGSAKKDLKAAVKAPTKRRRGPSAATRGGRAAKGLAKLALLGLWLALPLLAALARGEVAHGEWPNAALFLTYYPPLALGVTSLFLFVEAARDFRESLLQAVRGIVVAVATMLYLFAAYRDPAFDAYRHSLPGLVLVETFAAFLLGAASDGRA